MIEMEWKKRKARHKLAFLKQLQTLNPSSAADVCMGFLCIGKGLQDGLTAIQWQMRMIELGAGNMKM